MTECVIQGCARPVHVKSRGWCQTHYMRWSKHGDPLAYKRKKRATCTIEGCDLPAAGQGLCQKHYTRLRRYGTTDKFERPTVCVVDGCERPVDARSKCDMHYRREMSGNDGPRLCDWCGTEIGGGVRGRRKFCSPEHQRLAARETASERYRDTWLRKYGLTQESYESKLREQGGRCAICGSVDPRGRAKSPHFVVDHDHDTGATRGLLCAPCNNGIGHLGDSIETVAAALAYLRAYSTT